MRPEFAPWAWDDYTYWRGVDRTVVKRTNRLVDETVRNSFGGIGKPEPRKYGLPKA